ncbi:MAG: DUF5362 family protein [bacterium]
MDEKVIVQELSAPIFQSKGWLKLLGVVMILQGVLTALTIVGIIFCWLPIWMGILLMQAAGSVESAQISGDKTQLVETLKRLKTYFVINGVLMLLGLLGAAIALLTMGGAMFAMMSDL